MAPESPPEIQGILNGAFEETEKVVATGKATFSVSEMTSPRSVTEGRYPYQADYPGPLPSSSSAKEQSGRKFKTSLNTF